MRALKQPPDIASSAPLHWQLLRSGSQVLSSLAVFSCLRRHPYALDTRLRSRWTYHCPSHRHGPCCCHLDHLCQTLCNHSPPYKLSCSSSSMSMISQSNTLSPTKPTLMPGISLSVCICLNCLPSRIAALELPPGELVARSSGDAMTVRVRCARRVFGDDVVSKEE